MNKLKSMRHLNAVFILFFILFTSNSNYLFSQSRDAYTIKRYSSTNGLPQNTIRSMAMDDSRFLWLTTEEGLVRFDGRDFKIYNQKNLPGINDDRFRWIMKTADGKLVISELTGSTFILKNGEAQLIYTGPRDRSNDQFIRGAAPNVKYYLGSLKRHYPGIQKEELPDYPMYIAGLSGRMYGVALRSQFRIFKDSTVVRNIDMKPYGEIEYFSIDNTTYFVNGRNNVFLINEIDGTVKSCTITGDLTAEKTKSYRLPRNIIWSTAYPDIHVRTEDKLFRLKKTKDPTILETTFVTAQLPTNCNITNVIYDTKSQNLFIGTDTKGLYSYRKNKFTTLIYEDQYHNQINAYYSQCAIDSNTIFTMFRKEFSLDTVKISKMPIRSGSVECIYIDSLQRIFYTIRDSLFFFNMKTSRESHIDVGPVREIYCFRQSGDSVLIGTRTGVGYMKNDVYHHIYHSTDFTNNTRIEDLEIGPDENIWVARCQGIARLDLKTALLQDVPGLNGVCARVLYREKNRMLVGTYGNGYYVWEKDSVYEIPLDKGQNLSHVHSFLIDGNNYLWMSTNKGLFRTRYQNVLNFIKNKNSKIQYEYFGQDDGILNNEFNGGCSPPVVRLANGYVSYPTMEGLVWFIPENIPPDQPDENIVIDEIYIDGKKTQVLPLTEIPSRHENIEIRFATPYWGNNSNMNLEYKLEGLNNDWIPIDPDKHNISFSKLSSGTYSFKLRKLSRSGPQPYLESSITFFVHKKYYETTAFIFLTILAGAGLFYLLLLWNSRRIIIKNNELEKKISERTIELKNVNNQLEENFQQLAQKERFLSESIDVKNRLISIISHDIITPLKFISMVSRISKRNPDLLERNKLIESMNDIEFASDKLYNNASNILNWMKFQNNRIAPKKDHIAIHDFIDDIVEPLIGMADTKGLQILNLVAEEDLIISDRNILMIILQNVLSNAIKYSEKGTITFNSYVKDSHYFITVRDNGIGISPEIKSNIEEIILRNGQLTGSATGSETGNQLGYYIIIDFLQLLDGTIAVDSQPGNGTTVTIGLPDIA